ncbi:Exopolyphosphatase [hydrothermal vent metagenome]|uniref:Exopolyphosphatase n=1 Tax=hydrothermal vent metagenome TaxID=652676 RepID=A0A1W1EHT3_9ZZZZ
MISIDLGSNSMRIIKFNCQNYEVIKDFSRVVKIADGLSSSGRIKIESAQRVIDTINDAKEIIDFDDKIYAVTTQALREASNSKEILEFIESESGVRFEIISGELEAKYTLLAVESRINIISPNTKSFVLIDIGGGSTEIIFKYQDRVVSKSFSVGIVTISQSYKNVDEVKENLPKLMSDMLEFTNDIYSKYGMVDKFIATAGTPTTIASLKCGLDYLSYDPLIVEGTTLNIIELDRYSKELSLLDKASLIKAVGSGRDEVIYTGVEIYKYLFEILRFEESVVVDFGLVEGLAIYHC